jgi:hypothetical protein
MQPRTARERRARLLHLASRSEALLIEKGWPCSAARPPLLPADRSASIAKYQQAQVSHFYPGRNATAVLRFVVEAGTRRRMDHVAVDQRLVLRTGVSRIEKCAPYKGMKEHHVLVGGRVEIKRVLGVSLPATQLRCG